MGIWIRSQDKESLLYCIIVDMTKNRNGQYIIEAFASGFNEMYLLGTYSTKEKALKVLDMIEKCIEFNNSHHNSQWDSTPYFMYNVFNMPQEKGV